jgi:hypothetical protein
MIRPRLLAALAFLAATTLAPAAAGAAPARPLTLADCLTITLERNPDVALAREEVAAAEAGRRAARGLLGPRLRLEGNVMRWDSAQAMDCGSIPGLPLTIPPFQVRDATTTSATVSVIQPLTLRALSSRLSSTSARNTRRNAWMASAMPSRCC